LVGFVLLVVGCGPLTASSLFSREWLADPLNDQKETPGDTWRHLETQPRLPPPTSRALELTEVRNRGARGTEPVGDALG
jgi:hypothetical protein